MGQGIYEQASEEFECDHRDVALRRRTVQVGAKQVVHLWRQCLRCGSGRGAVKKATLSPAAEAELEPYDEDLPARWRAAWQARISELRAERDADQSEEWWARYDAYLQTPAWQEIRRRVLARDRHVCQGCLGACGLPATQAHHLSYEHVGEEFAWELVAICKACHERLHGRPMPAAPVHSDRVPDWSTTQQLEAALRGDEGLEILDEVPF